MEINLSQRGLVSLNVENIDTFVTDLNLSNNLLTTLPETIGELNEPNIALSRQ